MKHWILHIIIIVCATSCFTSCISSEEVNYLQDIESDYKIQAYKEYQLRPGDAISVSISTRDPKFATKFESILSDGRHSSRPFRIQTNGILEIPLMGKAHLEGLTLQEAEDVIEKLVQESLVDANVKLNIINNNFYVVGEQKRGTFYVYKENMTIYQALAISGQTSENMDISKVSILRKDFEGNTIVKTFDLRSQEVIQSEFYYIYPNDVIYFPTNKNAFFSLSSVSTFVTAITVPLTFLVYVTTYRF